MLSILRARMRRLVQCARAEIASRQALPTIIPAPAGESESGESPVRAGNAAPSVSALSNGARPVAAADEGDESKLVEAAPRRMRPAPDSRLALRLYAAAARARLSRRASIVPRPQSTAATACQPQPDPPFVVSDQRVQHCICLFALMSA